MKKVAVIGHPISHSLSPKLHNYWIKKYGIDAHYEAIDVEPKDLRNTIKRMQKEGYVGCNVTIPHKEAMLDIVDKVYHVAKSIGAINIIVFKDGKICGDNTDSDGFLSNIVNNMCDYEIIKKALVIGAGGAALAVCHALFENESNILLTNRTRDRAEKLAEDFSKDVYGKLLDENLRKVKVIDWNEKEKYLSDIDLLVNTTSLGMVGMPPLDIDLSNLNKDALVTDIVYKPLITPLLAQAEAQGNPIVDGLGMLLYQAQASFAIWFGIAPEVNQELRDYILKNME